MYAKTLITAAIALIGTASSIAWADMPAPLTRAEVIEALVQARAAGQIQYGEQTVVFEAKASAPGLTRADVIADLREARAAGQVQYGDRTVAFTEPFASTLTRAQVHAETLEAIRLGAISRGENNSFPTEAQLESIRMAGLKALPMTMAAR